MRMSTDEMETLFCERGQHDWSRERKRGKKPLNCPEHVPKKQLLDPAERIRRQQEGRAARKLEADAEGIAEVLAWREWLKADAAVWGEYRSGFITRDEWLAKKPEMIAQPSGKAWAAAKSAGLVDSDPIADEAEEVELT